MGIYVDKWVKMRSYYGKKIEKISSFRKIFPAGEN